MLIIKNINDLYSFPAATRSDLVLQSLIRGRTCYRTEFVGNDSFTFTQLIEFQDDCLSFKYTKMVVSTPLSSQIKGKLIRLMATMGVQAFSVEYFLKVGQPSIVDCNMTSNYQYFFINRVREQLGRAWLNLINHEVI